MAKEADSRQTADSSRRTLVASLSQLELRQLTAADGGEEDGGVEGGGWMAHGEYVGGTYLPDPQ